MAAATSCGRAADVGAPGGEVELPPGDEPLVLVAPSTAQDPEHRLLRAALRGLADAPVRVLATWNRACPRDRYRSPDNARVVDWVSYARTMPRCDVVVCHAGHGTLVRALAWGCAVVACPAVGDMNENAARLDWAGAGVRLPRRFVSPRPLRLAVERALDEPRSELGRATWRPGRRNDPGDTAAALVERFAAARTEQTAQAERHMKAASDYRLQNSSAGGARTHNLSINSRALGQSSCPGPCTHSGNRGCPQAAAISTATPRLHLSVTVGAQQHALPGLGAADASERVTPSG